MSFQPTVHSLTLPDNQEPGDSEEHLQHRVCVEDDEDEEGERGEECGEEDDVEEEDFDGLALLDGRTGHVSRHAKNRATADV